MYCSRRPCSVHVTLHRARHLPKIPPTRSSEGLPRPTILDMMPGAIAFLPKTVSAMHVSLPIRVWSHCIQPKYLANSPLVTQPSPQEVARRPYNVKANLNSSSMQYVRHGYSTAVQNARKRRPHKPVQSSLVILAVRQNAPPPPPWRWPDRIGTRILILITVQIDRLPARHSVLLAGRRGLRHQLQDIRQVVPR